MQTRIILATLLAASVARADDVGGPILTDTTWNLAGSPYRVISPIVIGGDATLTVEPGVIVRFQEGMSLTVGSNALGSGALIASGTDDEPVSFTSDLAEPMRGDWAGIVFTSFAVESEVDENGAYLGGSRLNHCHITYAGGDGSIVIIDRTLHVDGCTVSASEGPGINHDSADDRLVLLDSLLTDCRAPGADGGGVLITGGVGHLLRGCDFIDNSAANGGGLYASASDALFEDLTFIDNNTGVLGGGAYVDGSGTFLECTFESNIAEQGGGLWCDSHTVSNTVFTGNSAQVGGGLYATNATAVLACSFLANQAIDGGGLYTEFVTVVDECLFNANIAEDGGGAYIQADQSQAQLSGLVVTGNTAAFRGGGLRLFGEIELADSTISGNTSLRGGGVLLGWAGFDDITLTNVHVLNNIALTGGGGIRCNEAEGTLIEGCTVDDNIAFTIGGGLMLGNSPDVVITQTSISGNLAGADGGAIWSNSLGVVAEGTMDAHNVIAGNDAQRGAAIFNVAPFDDEGSGDMLAAMTCWGTNDIDEIQAMIWDHFDDPAVGIVGINPIVMCADCIADCDANGTLDILDFVCFQQRFQAGEPDADCNGDGVLNILDFVCFQQAFEQGC